MADSTPVIRAASVANAEVARVVVAKAASASLGMILEICIFLMCVFSIHAGRVHCQQEHPNLETDSPQNERRKKAERQKADNARQHEPRRIRTKKRTSTGSFPLRGNSIRWKPLGAGPFGGNTRRCAAVAGSLQQTRQQITNRNPTPANKQAAGRMPRNHLPGGSRIARRRAQRAQVTPPRASTT